MTKKIRIENADTSSHMVRVWVEDLIDGQWVRTYPAAFALEYPTAMSETYIHGTRRIVVEELP